MATTRDCEVSFSFLSKDEQPNQTSWRCRTTKGIREWTWWMVWKDGRKATGAEGRRRWTEFGSRSVKVYLRRLHPRGREEKLEGRWVATSTWGRTTRTWWMFWTRGDGNNGSEGEEETMDSVWIKKFKLCPNRLHSRKRGENIKWHYPWPRSRNEVILLLTCLFGSPILPVNLDRSRPRSVSFDG
ncbi:hypothetical protein GW17_00035416 [Ensete ventricosum]|nr:hypothetical protein GW17_00035416 [Ensete ventricosum]